VDEVEAPSEDRSVGELLRELLSGCAPTEDPSLCPRAIGPVEESAVRVFIYADVLRELRKAAVYRQDSATALLTGQIAFDERGPFVEIAGFQELNYLFGADPVELSRPGLLQRMGDVEEILSGEFQAGQDQVVGAFFSRPGGEAMLDEEMVRLHLSLHNRSYQGLLVMDGESDRVGLYLRSAWEPFVNLPFFVVERASHVGGEDQPKDEEECDE
jgi:hypothetical protein